MATVSSCMPRFSFSCCPTSDLTKLSQLLARQPESLNLRTGCLRSTLLHRCVQHNRLEMVRLLLERGATCSLGDMYGNRPIHSACLVGNRAVVDLLLEHSGHLETENKDSDRPLHVAAAMGNLEVVTLLLERGAGITSQGWRGNSALHSAAEQGRTEVVRELVLRGLEVTSTNSCGETPLHLAAGARAESTSTLELLLDLGASLVARSSSGECAVHRAAETGRPPVLRLLLQAGSSILRADCGRPSLLDLVVESGNKEKCSLVIEAMMEARTKWARNHSLSKLCSGERINYMRQELTEQEMELQALHLQVRDNPKDPESVFQKLLESCPDALEVLLDGCLLAEQENEKKRKVILDFAPFSFSSPHCTELSTIDCIVSAGKLDLLDHPLFELFVLLKWAKVHKVVKLLLFLFLLHILTILLFVLARFGSLFSQETATSLLLPSLYIFTISNAIVFLIQVAKTINLHYRIRSYYKSTSSYSLWSDQAMLLDLLHHIQTGVTPLLGWALLAFPSRPMAAILVLYSNWHLLMNLTMFPSLGVNTHMTVRVMHTVVTHLLAYSPFILAYSVAFHILLPASKTFRYVT